MTDLQQFIQQAGDSRELKRALAVQNTLAGRPWNEVASELGVTRSFIGKWRWRYKRDGLPSLRIGYTGSRGKLTEPEKAEVLKWIQAQASWDVRALSGHIATTYGVCYKSLQSYYTLLKRARISWKRTHDQNPRADPKKIAAKREAIRRLTLQEAPAIIVKRTVELAVDECHLLWGDACGYAWSPRNTRASIPITNIRTRQSYYGALNLLTGWAILWKATAGNKENTVQFLTYLRQYFQGRRMIILWDGASYHTAHLVRDYLTRVNGPDCPLAQRHIHLVQFAPAAPLQNPMEDVWLAGKRQVRRQWTELTTFADVQTVFSSTILKTPFLFNKLNWYGREQLITGRRLLGFRWE